MSKTPVRRPHAPPTPLDQFIALSAELTGFTAAELWSTGLVETYYGLIPSIVGDAMFGRFMTRWRYTWERGAGDEPLLHQLIKDQLFEDPDFGPLVRNLAAVWYTGQWNQLPADWRNRHGAWANDQTFIVSPAAYAEGLVWKAMGTHPQAAKQPGYGSWALPPVDGSRP